MISDKLSNTFSVSRCGAKLEVEAQQNTHPSPKHTHTHRWRAILSPVRARVKTGAQLASCVMILNYIPPGCLYDAPPQYHGQTTAPVIQRNAEWRCRARLLDICTPPESDQPSLQLSRSEPLCNYMT